MDKTLQDIAEQLVIASKRTYLSHLQTGSGGNVSARIGETGKMLVKASGSCLYDSTADSFVVCNFNGDKLAGSGEPTKEAFLHGLIYKLCPKAMAVVHTHSPYAVAYASRQKPLTRTTWHAKLKMNDDLPVLDIPSAMVKPEYEGMIRDMFITNPQLMGFLLVDHGLVAIGKTPLNAEQNAELIEETAKILLLKKLAEKIAL